MKRVRIDTLLSERGHVPVALRRRGLGAGRRRAAAARPPAGREARPARVRRRRARGRQAPPFVSRGGRQAAQRARRVRGSTWRVGGRSTSAPRPAGSPTACSRPGPLTWSRSTSPTASSTGGSASDPRVTVIERCNARSLAPDQLPYAPELIVIDVSFISLAKVLPAVLGLRGGAVRLPGADQAPVRGRARAVGKGGVVRDAAARRGALVDVGAAARGLGASVLGLRQLRAARARRATSRRSCGWPRRARDGEVGPRCRRARGRALNPVRTATVLTHRRPSETRPAIDALVEIARARRRDPVRRPRGDAQAPTRARRRGSRSTSTGALDVDICFALGGDGTILTALRSYAGTGGRRCSR